MEAISVSTNEINTYTVSELDYIRENIERMNRFYQIETLRLLSKHRDVTLNENKNGTLVNLSELNNTVILELLDFIEYVNKQEKNLMDVEKMKENYKTEFFNLAEKADF